MITIIIIVITVIFSITAFFQRPLFEKLKFNAYYIRQDKQWYRFFTHGLIHADWVHLLINMMVLYSFGRIVELKYSFYLDAKSTYYYLLLYVSSLIISSVASYEKHKNNIYYSAVGASGAVSAVLFSSILLYPKGKIMLMFLPIPLPSPVFGVLYLIYSAVMAKKAKDNIGHDAHFWGAVFGIVFTILCKPLIAKDFITQIMAYFQ